MELLTAPTISKFPLRQCPHRFSPTTIRFQPLFHRTTYFPSLHNQIVFGFGLQYHRNSSLRSATSEEMEISTDTTVCIKDEPETVDDTQPVENREDYESQLNKELQEGSLFNNPLKLFKFLQDLNIKLDYEETYSFLAFGSGGAVAFWLVAAIIGAIDSIPVLPKALELVGLGYSLWFSSRYLILKKIGKSCLLESNSLNSRFLARRTTNTEGGYSDPNTGNIYSVAITFSCLVKWVTLVVLVVYVYKFHKFVNKKAGFR